MCIPVIDLRHSDEMDRWQEAVRAITPGCGFRLGTNLTKFINNAHPHEVQAIHAITVESIMRMNLLGQDSTHQKMRLQSIERVMITRAISITEAT